MMKQFAKNIIATFLFILVSFITVNAQDLLKSKDLSVVKVDLMTDADILKIRQQLSTSSVTIDELRSQLLLKGMSSTEFMKLKKRLESSTKKRNVTSGKYKVVEKKDDELVKKGRKLSSTDEFSNLTDEEFADSLQIHH